MLFAARGIIPVTVVCSFWTFSIVSDTDLINIASTWSFLPLCEMVFMFKDQSTMASGLQLTEEEDDDELTGPS